MVHWQQIPDSLGLGRQQRYNGSQWHAAVRERALLAAVYITQHMGMVRETWSHLLLLLVTLMMADWLYVPEGHVGHTSMVYIHGVGREIPQLLDQPPSHTPSLPLQQQ